MLSSGNSKAASDLTSIVSQLEGGTRLKMSHKIIPIPGGSTQFEDGPILQVSGNANSPINLSIKYCAAEIVANRPAVYGLIVFSSVLEYRWQEGYLEYEDFAAHKDDYEFGLIEVINSEYIKNIAAKGVRADFSEHRFGEGVDDAEVKHYRLAFDEYGRFDVIALSVSVSEISEGARLAGSHR